MDWGKFEFKDDKYSMPDNWLLIHYYEALTILFRLENSLRVFVYTVLKDHHSTNWTMQSIVTEQSSKTLSEIFSWRKNQSDDFGYIGEATYSPLMYLTLGELSNLITGSNWNLFKEHFPAKRDIIKVKFDEINVLRNSLAHFRTIRPEDVELTKIYANQILQKVAKYLNSVTYISNEIPTNSEEAWYKDLHNLKNEFTSIELKESSDTHWVSISITLKCGILDPSNDQGFLSEDFLNIDSHQILKVPHIKKNIIYITETKLNSYYLITKSPTAITKKVNLVFSRKNLNENYESEIKNELQKILNKINNEAKAVISDNLHKGEFIMSKRAWFNVEGKYWKCSNPDALSSRNQSTTEPEFWERIDLVSDYITWIPRFPWMGNMISKDEFPF